MEVVIVDQHRDFPGIIFPNFNEMRESELFCDITIQVEDELFQAHRVVLIATCDYFKTMLVGNFVERDKQVIEVNYLNADAFRSLLEYMYTGVLRINPIHATEILSGADLLGLQWVKEKSADYIEKHVLTVHNANEIEVIAGRHYCNDLEEKAHAYANPPNDSIFITPNIFGDLRCYNYNINMGEFTSLTNCSDKLGNFHPIYYKDKVYLTCGQHMESSEFLKVCPIYNVRTNDWSEVEFQSDRYNHGACVLKDKIYLVGGIYNNHKNDTAVYDFETGEIVISGQLKRSRNGHGIAVRKNSIYVCGGEIPFQVVNIVKNTSTFEYSTHVCDNLDDSICIIDPLCDSPDEYRPNRNEDENLGSCERFDPREGKWEIFTDMGQLKGPCSSAMIFNDLYCAQKTTGLVKKFDIRGDTWDVMPNLPNTSNVVLIPSGRELYAVMFHGIFRLNTTLYCWDRVYFGSTLTYPSAVSFPNKDSISEK